MLILSCPQPPTSRGLAWPTDGHPCFNQGLVLSFIQSQSKENLVVSRDFPWFMTYLQLSENPWVGQVVGLPKDSCNSISVSAKHWKKKKWINKNQGFSTRRSSTSQQSGDGQGYLYQRQTTDGHCQCKSSLSNQSEQNYIPRVILLSLFLCSAKQINMKLEVFRCYHGF